MPPPIIGVFRRGNLPAEASEPRRLASAVVPGLTGLHCSACILFARSQVSDVRINPLFAGSGMARLIRETAGRFMRAGIALRICNLADADEPSLKEDDVCGVQARRFHG